MNLEINLEISSNLHSLLLLLLLSRFSRVRLCATPWTAAYQASPSMGFSRQELTGVGCHFLLQCMKVKSLSRVWLLATPWTAAYQAPPSMGFSGQQYWSGVPLPSPKATRLPNEDLLDTNPRSEHMTSSKLFHCIEGWKKHLSFRDDVWKLSGP